MSITQSNCASCGKSQPLHLLDAKPEHLAGPGGLIDRILPNSRRLDRLLEPLIGLRRVQQMIAAGDTGVDFERLECRNCYGPGWAEGVKC